jgi:MFS family permease
MLYARRLRGYRPLLNVGLIIFLWTVGGGALWFLLPQIAENITGDVALVGLFISIPALVAVFVDLPIGGLTDRVGGRRVLLFGLVALGVLAASLLYVDTTVELAVFLVFLGLLYQTVYIPVMAYVMNISPKRESSEYMGLEMGLIHSGFAVGPIAAGLMLAFGYSMLEAGSTIYIVGCTLAFTAAMVWFTYGGREGMLAGIKDLMVKDKVFLRELADYGRLKSTGVAVLAMTFLFTFYDGAVWLLEPLYYSRFTTNPLLGGLVLAAFVLPLIFFELPGGYLADRYGRRRVLAAGLLVAGVSTIAFSVAADIPSLFATAFIASTGLALAWPSMEGILTVESTAGDRGGVVGVWSTARDFGYVVGPVGGGILGSVFGLDSVFTILGLTLLAALILVPAIRER